jgi:hypothetical protein
MMPASDIRTLTSHNSDAHEAVTSIFEALEKWRDEVTSVNERHLTKALDLLASSQRSLGWPDQFATATREYLLKASKIQTQMISQVMDAWEKQLKASASPPALPEAFQFQISPRLGLALKESVSDMVRMQELALVTPFRLWMQAAEMWQRNWAEAMTGPYELRQERPARRAAN